MPGASRAAAGGHRRRVQRILVSASAHAGGPPAPRTDRTGFDFAPDRLSCPRPVFPCAQLGMIPPFLTKGLFSTTSSIARRAARERERVERDREREGGREGGRERVREKEGGREGGREGERKQE